MKGDGLDGAIQRLLTGAHDLDGYVVTTEGRAAALAVSASVTLLLCHVRSSPVPGAYETALRELTSAVSVLRGDDAGTEAIPTRYNTEDRETLDRIRDLFRSLFDQELGDAMYVAGALFNIVKYLDRRGKKGPADLDDSKALFYLQTVAHVLLGYPDPRHRRPTFERYQQQRSAWPPALFDLLSKLEGGQSTTPWADMMARFQTISRSRR